VGTEGFVPPEGPGAPTGDSYSFGKVLCELCTGRDRKDYPELPTAIAESPDRERLLVARGNQEVDQGNLAESLPWFLEALKRVSGDQALEQNHRIRLASVIRRMPRMVQIIRPYGGMGQGEFSPDGLQFATAGHTAARVWDVTTGKEALPSLTHDGIVISAQFSRDGKRIITASLDKTARIRDRTTGQQLTSPLPHDSEGAYIWNVDTGALLAENAASAGSKGSIRFSKDGLRAEYRRDGQPRLFFLPLHSLEVRNGIHTPHPIPLPVRGEGARCVSWIVG
jgi:WD40 repeat protein